MTCSTCEYFIDSYLQSNIHNISIQTVDFVNNTITNKCIMEENEPGTGICNNQQSEFYMCGISCGGWCKEYMKKKNKQEVKYDFSVFDNYKCDGQLMMKFTDAGIEYVEEEKDSNIQVPTII